ncbi:PIR protein [Plasmodium ovale]|uniref:PIR protein n=1 Tax=Plasmodium ovale TaxID=36330 RepID=A0A1C3KJF6_PLAOA|nr:PIR protein [Plasmodium ovale]
MSESKGDNILILLTENDTFVKNPELKLFYEELDTVCSKGEKSGCDVTTYDKYPDDHKFTTFYKKLHGIKKKFSSDVDKFENLKNEPTKRCMYLKYWFYNQVIHNGFTSNEIMDIFQLWDNSYNKIEFSIKDDRINVRYGNSDGDADIKCLINFTTVDDIKKVKVLFDYTENYHGNKKKISINKKICGTIYEDYIKRTIGICNVRDSRSSNESGFCKELNEYKDIYGITTLPELECTEEEEEEEEEDEETETQYVDTEGRANALSSLIRSGGDLYNFATDSGTNRSNKGTSIGLVLRKRNVLSNEITEDTCNLPEYSSELDDTNLNMGEHYIAYHPS